MGILKGWVDRVFTYHFAYGVGEHSDNRYGEGTLAGRRALLSVTIGSMASHYDARGVNGPIDDLLRMAHHRNQRATPCRSGNVDALVLTPRHIGATL